MEATEAQKVLVPMHKAVTPKEKFEKKAYLLPPAVLAKLKDKTMRVGDDFIYAQKFAGGLQLVNMFASGDKKAIAESNIAFGKMPSNKYFCVSGIIVLSGLAASNDNTTAVGSLVDFDQLAKNLANAEFEFKIGQKIYFEDATLQVFKHNRTDIASGYYELSEPIMILSDEDIRFDIKLAAAAPANTWVKVILVGAITGKN